MAATSLWHLDAVSLAPARLQEVTLSIEPGITAVLGWSGAGKSSLLNVLTGFEPPSRGQVARPARISWMPQDGGLWPGCTAREHLAIVGASPAQIGRLADDLGLTSRLAARPPDLSQGERSRLAIARALATPAAACVLDEPLAHLDPARAQASWRAILQHLGEAARPLVYATHSVESVLGDAHQVICLHAGRVLYHGAVEPLFSAPATPELMWFLGPGNWFTPADAAAWLGQSWEAPRAVRPLHLLVEPVEAGGLEVLAARFLGTSAEIELRGPAGTRRFFHRPSSPRLIAGQRVRLQHCPA